jgi:hypothetical protein
MMGLAARFQNLQMILNYTGNWKLTVILCNFNRIWQICLSGQGIGGCCLMLKSVKLCTLDITTLGHHDEWDCVTRCERGTGFEGCGSGQFKMCEAVRKGGY